MLVPLLGFFCLSRCRGMVNRFRSGKFQGQRSSAQGTLFTGSIDWHMLLQTFWPENKMWILYSQLRVFTPQSSLPEVTATISETWLCEPHVMPNKWDEWLEHGGSACLQESSSKLGSPYSCTCPGRPWEGCLAEKLVWKESHCGGKKRKKRVQLNFETS